MAQIRRYGEPAAYLAVAGLCLAVGARALGGGAWLGIVPLAVGVLAALAALGAFWRAAWTARTARMGPGVVTIQEGRISYFGPDGGAVLALDALMSVEIETTDRGPAGDDLFWHLADSLGQRVAIPGGAHGAAALLDRLSSLDGFDHAAVLRASTSTGNARFRVWSHPDADAPRLPAGRPGS